MLPPRMARPSRTVPFGQRFLISIRPIPLPSWVQNGAMIVALIGFKAGIIDQGVSIVLVLMSLITTIITPIVYRNWFFSRNDCHYDARGQCIEEGI